MDELTRREATEDLANEAAADLAELEFSPLTPEEAAEVDGRVYLLGVRPEIHNIR